MTTIVYHDGVIAADTRATKRVEAGYSCLDGPDADIRLVNNKCGKIRTYLPRHEVFYNKESVRAIGCAGSSLSISKMMQLVRHNQVGIEKVFSVMRALKIGSSLSSFTMLIVTDQHAYVIHHLDHDAGHPIVTTYSLDDTVVIGSGGMAAKGVITLLDLSAAEGVAAAMLCDKSTGGDIHWYSLADTRESGQIHMSELGLEVFKQSHTLFV